jgi:hypothetical protein
VTATADGAVRYRVCPQVHSDDFPATSGVLLNDPVPRCRSSSGGVVVTPPQTEIAPGASRQFTAVVEDTSEQAVTWAVQNGAGGTITPTGLFTSNGALGTFFVTATSVADPQSVGIAQVTVADPAPPPPPPPGQSCEGTQCVFRGSLTVTQDGTVVVPGVDATVTQFIPSAPLPNTVGFPVPGFIGCGFGQSFLYIVTRGDAFTGMSAPNSCLPGSTIQGTVTPSGLDFTVSSPDGFSLSFSGTRVPLP